MKFSQKLLLTLLFSILILVIYIALIMNGPLEGEVVFEYAEHSAEGIKIFLLNRSIGPVLDTLRFNYDNNVKFLEDSVKNTREELKDIRDLVRKEEAVFRITFGNNLLNTAQYKRNRAYIDGLTARRDSLENLYTLIHESLMEQQTGYNNVIATLLNNKLFLEATADNNGRFKFETVRRKTYYIYARRVFAGNEDITAKSRGAQIMYAITGKELKEYTWLFKVDVDRKTYLKLDSSNTSDVYK